MNITVLYGIFFCIVIGFIICIMRPWELLYQKDKPVSMIYNGYEPPPKMEEWVGDVEEEKTLDSSFSFINDLELNLDDDSTPIETDVTPIESDVTPIKSDVTPIIEQADTEKCITCSVSS